MPERKVLLSSQDANIMVGHLQSFNHVFSCKEKARQRALSLDRSQTKGTNQEERKTSSNFVEEQQQGLCQGVQVQGDAQTEWLQGRAARQPQRICTVSIV